MFCPLMKIATYFLTLCLYLTICFYLESEYMYAIWYTSIYILLGSTCVYIYIHTHTHTHTYNHVSVICNILVYLFAWLFLVCKVFPSLPLLVSTYNAVDLSGLFSAKALALYVFVIISVLSLLK